MKLFEFSADDAISLNAELAVAYGLPVISKIYLYPFAWGILWIKSFIYVPTPGRRHLWRTRANTETMAYC
jgi:hypothetical protein